MKSVDLYWKGDHQPTDKILLHTEWGKEEYNIHPISLSHMQPKSFPPIPYEPMPEWWVDKINSVKKRIHKGEIQKEVIHRKITLPTPNIHPYEIMKGLERKSGTHYILKNPHKNIILFGITPEKPIQRIHDQIQVEILGGTQVQNEPLIDKPKSVEHILIVEDLIHTLHKNNIQNIKQSPIGIKNIHYTQHLQTLLHFTTQLPNQTLIPLIHPNLAVRGNPKGREYFGGLIGWETPEELHLYLTIRCGIWDGNHYHLWVGCGITEYSDPHREWEETYQKLKWIER